MIFKSLSIEKSWSEAIASRNMAQITNICLVIVCLLLSGKLFFSKPHTIVTPPIFTEPVTMIGDMSSPEYSIGWAIFTAQMLGNINPKNITFTEKVISQMLSPNLQANIADSMSRAAEIMRVRKVQQSFFAQDAVHDPNTGIVYIWGKKTTHAVRREPIIGKWTFEIKVESRNGMPRITYIKQYQGVPSKQDLKGKSKTPKVIPDYLSQEIDDAINSGTSSNTENNINDKNIEKESGPAYLPDITKDNKA